MSGSKPHLRVPWPNRFSLRFNILLAAGLWVEFGRLATRDWTLILAPLIFTAIVVFQWCAFRKIYAVIPATPRPDYSAIARMEREVYGETFKHEGAPRTSALDPEVAQLHAMMDDLAERATARQERARARCYCNYCRGRAGAYGAEAKALYRAEASAAMAMTAQPVTCKRGHPDQLWVEERGQMCPTCERHRREDEDDAA